MADYYYYYYLHNHSLIKNYIFFIQNKEEIHCINVTNNMIYDFIVKSSELISIKSVFIFIT